MLAKKEFLIAKYEMLVTLATVSVIKLLAFFFSFWGPSLIVTWDSRDNMVWQKQSAFTESHQ